MQRCQAFLFVFLVATLLGCTSSETDPKQDVVSKKDVQGTMDAALGSPHPRLFLEEHDLSALNRQIQGTQLQDLDELVRSKADTILDTEPVERGMEGIRLQGESEALRRIVHLSFAYRRTGNQQYAERAEAEMLAAADFKDWNPDHFLDVAQMTFGLAVGYDWLHDELSSSSRRTIRNAIIEKGLKPSFAEDWWWIDDNNNWNQVCHGGLVLGALAVMDHAPDLATRVVERAVKNVRVPMRHYGPHGGYLEGPGYWSFGSHYNVLLIDALESALGTNFGLTEVDPFMNSPTFYLHAHTPTLRVFNYSDSGSNTSIAPAMYWFADRLGRPELLWMEKRKLNRLSADPSASEGWELPMLLVWAKSAQFDENTPPEGTHFFDTDPLALGLHRTRWDERAVFVGIEGGKASHAHGHMDAGSFVMEADGVRWAVDLGAQDYHPLEEADISLWDSNQDGDRWTIFRMNNFSHNTLVVNGQLQRADGFAPVLESEGASGSFTILDLSEVYAGQLAGAKRGVALLENGTVRVQDELRAPDDTTATVRWGMVTRANVELLSDRTAKLRQKGETLRVHVRAPTDAKVETYSMEPPAEYDAPNPNARMVGFKTHIETGAEVRLVVALLPAGEEASSGEIKPLANW